MQKSISKFIKMTLNTQILPVSKSLISFRGTSVEISDPKTKANLEIASKEVQKPGHVVAFPTETVYGLGGSALCDESVRAIYAAKNRPADNPLIVHVSSREQIERILLPKLHKIPAVYDRLIEKFWPGPLTILLPVEEGSPVLQLTTAGQNTVGVRMPSHPVARALIAHSDTPLAAPSANASTRPSPTMASHVYHDLSGRIPYILDGGACDVGVESTVVDGLSNPPMLLRPGGVSAEDIRKYGGGEWENIVLAKKTAGKTEVVRTPGMKYRHYLPTAKVVLFENCGNGDKAVKSWLEKHPEVDGSKVALLRGVQFNLASSLGLGDALDRHLGSSATEIAHNLFKMLREVDELGVEMILVEGVEEDGDGLAVMNRLSKAAFEVVH